MSSTKSGSFIDDSDDLSDRESQPAGPSVTRLSHFTRNYRRRIVDESSSDDEELINGNMERTSSTQRPAETVDVNYCHMLSIHAELIDIFGVFV